MELLVAEETVGYGTCLEVDSTSPRYLNLVPLMHQIRRGWQALQVVDYKAPRTADIGLKIRVSVVRFRPWPPVK